LKLPFREQSASIILLPDGKWGEDLLDLVESWSKNWLLQPAYWLSVSNIKHFEGRPPEVLATVIGRNGRREVDLFQQLFVNGTSFTARPDSLVGWVKCNSVNGDTSGIILQLTKWDAIALTQEQLGFGSFITTSTSTSFYRFSVPIEYVSENTPDSISVFVLSSIGNGQIGSAIWVDDLSLIYNTSSIGELNGTSFEVFPNPVNDELSISSKTVDKMEVYSATGILINHILIDSGLVASYDTKELANGLYLIKNSKGELKRFIVQH
jgi:hypothetical protein